MADRRFNADRLEPKRLSPGDVLAATDQRFAVECPRVSAADNWIYGGQGDL
ncbi:MAG TPA: hypothetical protein VKE40_15535 [Gemmataceae bacterium]|nr:hypothetical protein [Gemmataceae bacterium]